MQKDNEWTFVDHLKHTVVAHARYRWGHASAVCRAIEIAEEAHARQRRDGGEPFIVHPLRVALHFLLVYPGVTEQMLCVAILHDVLEDAPEWTRQKLAQHFCAEVAEGVEKLSKTTHERTLSSEEYKHLILNAPDYIRIIKLCDRLDNILSLRSCPDQDKVIRYLTRTEAYYRDFAKNCNETLLEVILEEIEQLKNEFHFNS